MTNTPMTDAPMENTEPKQIKVFVTTYAEATSDKSFKRGDWFDIADYADRTAFMTAAQDFIDFEFSGSNEVYTPDYQANFDAGECVGFNKITAEAWNAIK